jgi:nitrite reductase/ring-hydroxylating ferredoxin subunit/uncharacterized membrane protein
MRSAAHIGGHPLHAMLVHFPIAFLTGAFLSDAAGLVLDLDTLWPVGWYLTAAGVVGGIAAAIPGVIDYLRTVPPRSSARRRATWHMLVNVGALLVFALAWFIRGAPGVPPDPALVLIEGVGVALIAAGGWMGATLVFRNQIGVDHRYAGAGKWSESRLDGDVSGPIDVASADDLEVDQMKLLQVNGERIVLARTESGWVAFEDRCSHKGGSLAGGVLGCGIVHCPWHGSQFDVRTGAVCAGPAERPIRTYPVERVGERIMLHRGEGSPPE